MLFYIRFLTKDSCHLLEATEPGHVDWDSGVFADTSSPVSPDLEVFSFSSWFALSMGGSARGPVTSEFLGFSLGPLLGAWPEGGERWKRRGMQRQDPVALRSVGRAATTRAP